MGQLVLLTERGQNMKRFKYTKGLWKADQQRGMVESLEDKHCCIVAITPHKIYTKALRRNIGKPASHFNLLLELQEESEGNLSLFAHASRMYELLKTYSDEEAKKLIKQIEK